MVIRIVTAMLFIFVVQNTFAQTDSLELDDFSILTQPI